MKISHALLSTFLFIGLPSGCAYQDAFYSPASQESLRPPSKPRSFLPFVSETEILPIQRSTTSLDWNVSQEATGSTDFAMRTLYQTTQRYFTVRASANVGSNNVFSFFEGAKFQQTYPIFDLSKLDILVVVDNSQSIDTEQEKLSNTFHDLISQVKDRDWRIVVTSQEAMNCDATIISKGMPDAEANFKSAIKMGQTTSNSETPFYKTLRMLRAFGLERKDRNRGRATFTPAATACTYTDSNGDVKSVLRENVPVGVLILTNEDECSDGYNCPMIRANTRIVYGFYSDRYIGLSQTPYSGHFRVAGIYWPPGTATACAGAIRRGVSLNKSFTGTSMLTVPSWAQSYDICTDKFDSYVKSFSQSLGTIKNLYPLHFIPGLAGSLEKTGSLLVYKDGVLLPSTSYRIIKVYNTRFIELTAPEINSGVLKVEYELAGQSAQQEFVLNPTLLAQGFEFTGVLLQPQMQNIFSGIEFNNYTTGLRYLTAGSEYVEVPRGTDRVIVLNKTIVPGDRLTFNYRKIRTDLTEEEKASTQLRLGENVVVDATHPITITKSGKPYPADVQGERDSNGNYSITYEELPAGGYIVNYTTLNDPILSYPISVPYRAEILSVLDTGDLSAIPFNFLADTSKLVFRPHFILDGKSARASYKYWQVQQNELALPKDPVPNSVVVETAAISDPTCANRGNSLVSVANRILKIDCSNPAGVEKLVMKYDSLQLVENYSITIPRVAASGVEQKWKLYLNGLEVSTGDSRFSLTDSGQLTLSGQFLETDKITVKFSALLEE